MKTSHKVLLSHILGMNISMEIFIANYHEGSHLYTFKLLCFSEELKIPKDQQDKTKKL